MAAVLLPVEKTDQHLERFLRHLGECPRRRGVLRTVPLADTRAYREALKNTCAQMDGTSIVDVPAAILEDASGNHVALRLVEYLTN